MLGFSIDPSRLPWRALILARATDVPLLLTIRGGYLRLAVFTPALLVVLLEKIRPLPGRTLPADLEIVLNADAIERSMGSLLITRHTERRAADLVFLFDLGDPMVRIRYGLDYQELPVVTAPVPRYEDQDLIDVLKVPRVPSYARFSTHHLGLLRALLEPVGIQPHLITPVPSLGSDATRIAGMTPQERDRHLDDTAEVVRRSPGCYLDEHLIVRIQPDPDGVVLSGNDPDPDHPDR